jgi:periplasmic protein TonB
MAIMSFQALLFCPDEKTARVVTQVLSELDFNVEASNEPFAAVKKLMGQHYAAIVVDCDNEQNAALLFKSARNSATNTSCLFVAVVEGQTGVAKAFRIGANLVLTKPINIEQSKSTLRVARGLLRKAETSKAAAPPRPTSPSLLTPMPLVPSNIPAAAPSSSAFEYEAEPEPAPDPAEATLLEYMPDSVPSAEDHPSPSGKQFPWQPAPGLREPMASALRRAAEVAGKTEFDAHTPAAPGTAAAPARAKQKPAMPLEFRPATGSGSAKREEEMVEKLLPTGSWAATAEASPAAPTFSSLGSLREQEDSDSGAGKKKLLAVAVALVAALGYFGWTRIETSRHPAETRALSAANLQQPVAQPEATPAAVAENTAPAPAESQAEPSAPPAQKSEDLSTVSSSKPSAGKPAASMAAPAASSKAEAQERTQEPLIVKNDAPKPKTADRAEESVQPPTVIAAASPDEKTLSGIVSVPATVVSKPAQLTVKISQGVSQGLLVKKVQPLYPAAAKQLHLEGTVEVLATITKDGNVSSAKLLKGDSILGRAAIDAVRQWKYKPYYLNNDPVEVQTQVTVNFKLP